MNNSPSFPYVDPVGPFGAAMPEAVSVIASVVAPFAAAADAEGVSRATLDALAEAGLLGASLGVEAQREVLELLAGADASTWFCCVQHFSPMRTLAAAAASSSSSSSSSSPSSFGAGALVERYLAGMSSGAVIGAVAVAHLRRPGPPNPLAVRVDGGWVIDGTLDWVTSWDIADVWMLWAADDAGSVVAALLPAGRSTESVPGVSVGPPLRLLAMGGTHTRPVRLESVFVPDAQVVLVQSLDAWRAQDELKTPDANPATFGVVRGAVAELAELASQRGDAVLEAAVERFVAQCREVRHRAYTLAGTGPVPERLAARSESVLLAMRATSAVVAARAGAGMLLGESAERRVREAQFLAVQAQTRASRDALLELLSGGR